MFNVGIIGSKSPSAAVGEQLYTFSNPYQAHQFVVPAGVTSICAAAIGAGGSGARGSQDIPLTGAGGGSLSYRNNIAVTPGETLTVKTEDSYYIARAVSLIRKDSSGVESILLRANHGYGAGPPGGYGGAAYNAPDVISYAGGDGMTDYNGYDVIGGSAATFTANGAIGGGLGTFITGANATSGVRYGAGNITIRSGQFGPTIPGGALRIIWGAGRTYPYNSL